MLDREFVRHNNYARHRPIRSRALRSDSRNPGCSSPPDADGEICSLQKLRFRKWRQSMRSVSVAFFRNKRAQFTKNYLTHQRSFGKWISDPSPQSSPRKRGEAHYCAQASAFCRYAGIAGNVIEQDGDFKGLVRESHRK